MNIKPRYQKIYEDTKRELIEAKSCRSCEYCRIMIDELLTEKYSICMARDKACPNKRNCSMYTPSEYRIDHVFKTNNPKAVRRGNDYTMLEYVILSSISIILVVMLSYTIYSSIETFKYLSK